VHYRFLVLAVDSEYRDETKIDWSRLRFT